MSERGRGHLSLAFFFSSPKMSSPNPFFAMLRPCVLLQHPQAAAALHSKRTMSDGWSCASWMALSPAVPSPRSCQRREPGWIAPASSAECACALNCFPPATALALRACVMVCALQRIQNGRVCLVSERCIVNMSRPNSGEVRCLCDVLSPSSSLFFIVSSNENQTVTP
jgi:hypothetical protein